MKVNPSTLPSSVVGPAGGRVVRPRRDMENEEVHTYLSKLKELVPSMPRGRKLSKLEVIQYVIDYIIDLQDALETTPVVQITNGRSPNSNRQPLGVLAPNTIVSTVSCSTQESANTVSSIVQLFDKAPSPPDTRPVSV